MYTCLCLHIHVYISNTVLQQLSVTALTAFLHNMATKSEIESQPATQQGIEDSIIDYYDIMVIGKTGMGKSTTADKLLVANLDKHKHLGSQHSEPVIKGEQMTLDDLSIWLLSDAPGAEVRVTTRLKNLHFFRSMDKPHQEINQFHAEEQYESGITIGCELISNESTKVRVLDVPGFFGQGDSGALDASLSEKAKCTVNVALNTMRKILQIQATMHMKFRRILYFLPEQGGLKRPSSLLELELATMANYFGRAIFECMVVIVTIPAEVYKISQGPVVFPEAAMKDTRKHFDIALSHALPNEKKALPKPPIVFVSLTDSCETIFANINEATVTSDEVKLEFDPMVCARCGIKAGMIKSEKIAVYSGENDSSVIPYNESTCHPMLVPKYTRVRKFFGGIAHLLTMKKFLGKWPSFGNLEEICVACQNEPGSRGCMKVNSVYKFKGREVIVEHTQKTKEPVVIFHDKLSVSDQDKPEISKHLHINELTIKDDDPTEYDIKG